MITDNTQTGRLKARPAPTILYDYDDTLGGVKFPDGTIRPGAAAYEDCLDRFARYMAELGYDATVAMTKQREIDLVLAKTHGFSNKTRFGQSFVDTYREMSGGSFKQAEADECFAIGMSVFTDYPYALLDGALDVLKATKPNYRIAIITKGADDEQWKKLKATGVDEYADYVAVVGMKNQADWDKVLTDLGFSTPEDAKDSWAIGNSAKADVNPLLPLGFNGIEIVGKNRWAFEASALGEPLEGRTAQSITDISAVLDIVPIAR